MAKNKKIAIIGHFGGNESFLDGQTVKTKILYEELKNANSWNIQKVDTYYKKKNPFKLLISTACALITKRDIIVLLSGNGMKLYFPLLSFFARVFKTRIYHDVIGGNLETYVLKYPKFKRYLNSFKVNWVETQGLKDKLKRQGVNNCEVLPNFKRLNCVDFTDLTKNFSEPYRFCTFSRVMREKGIELAIDAIESINNDFGRTVCSLDIYGKVDDNYFEAFNARINNSTSAISYQGMIPYDKSVEIIKKYYMLLFPTFWDGEGFPGTIVDAFSAGLPVIASDWNCNSEIVDSFVNGIVYPNSECKDLKDAIMYSIKNSDKLYDMRINALSKALTYQPDEYIKFVCNYISKK